MKIEQSPKIAAQIIKALGDTQGHVTFNLNMNANGNVEMASENHDRDAFLISVLESFPQPRVRNFVDYIYSLVEQKFGDRNYAAKWLGIATRTLIRKNGPIGRMENPPALGRVKRISEMKLYKELTG